MTLVKYQSPFAFDKTACQEAIEFLEAISLGFLSMGDTCRQPSAPLAGLSRIVKQAYIVATYDGLAVLKRLILEMDWANDKKRRDREAGERSKALAALTRAAACPLLLLDCQVGVFLDEPHVSAGLMLAYCCDVVGQRPTSRIESASSGLSLLAHLCRSNRMGISFSIACCQSLLALNALTNAIRGQDLLVAIAGVLVNAAKLRTLPPSLAGRELTSSTWARELKLESQTPARLLRDAQSIACLTEDTPEQLLNLLECKMHAVHRAVFGRVRNIVTGKGNLSHQINATIEEIRSKILGNKGYDQTIMCITEQTSLLDVLLAKDLAAHLVLLYTPLSFANRLLLGRLIREYLPRLSHSFAFCPGAPLNVVEDALQRKVSEKRSSILIPGGTPAEYLVAMKLATLSVDVKLLEWPPRISIA